MTCSAHGRDNSCLPWRLQHIQKLAELHECSCNISIVTSVVALLTVQAAAVVQMTVLAMCFFGEKAFEVS
jgi:hypothetical protein